MLVWHFMYGLWFLEIHFIYDVHINLIWFVWFKLSLCYHSGKSVDLAEVCIFRMFSSV